ncbi:MAG: acylphosphatase [Clostridium sp.]
MERIHLIISGKVQGVGFRYFCQYQSLLNNITGFAKNLDNGAVEIEAQGTSPKLETFLNLILKGNGFSKVEDYKITNLPVENDEKKFKITY